MPTYELTDAEAVIINASRAGHSVVCNVIFDQAKSDKNGAAVVIDYDSDGRAVISAVTKRQPFYSCNFSTSGYSYGGKVNAP